MRYVYPCELTLDEGGWYLVTFPDVPEAGTDAKTREEALALAEDALGVALGGYVRMRLPVPAPSEPAAGQYPVALAPVIAAKLALYSAMRQQGLSNVAMAAKLGLTEGAVRKLISPDHRSHIGQVQTALKLLGRCMVLEDQLAPAAE